MSDYSPSQSSNNNFSQSSAFAAALQRAKQIAAKIHPGPQKRPHEDGPDVPESKKFMSSDYSNSGMNPSVAAAQAQAAAVAARLSQMSGNMGSEDVRIPDQAVGLVIGRGGEQISRLQAESGCKIQMNNDSGERLCTISGSRENIMRAKEMIQKIVNQHGVIETVRSSFGAIEPMQRLPMDMDRGDRGMGGGGGGGGGGVGRGGERDYGPYEEMMVPGPKVGLIIGKGGETIKMLQEKSGAKMVIIQDGPGQESEKPLRISGDPDAVAHAKQLVEELIGGGGPGGPGGRGGGGGDRGGFNGGRGGGGGGGFHQNSGDGVELDVFVPKAAVGVVIGKGGEMIKKIQAETGCKLQFLQGRNDEPGDRRCLVQGAQHQVEEGKRMIDDLIESVMRRENGERGGGRNGGGGGHFGGGGDRGDRGDYGGRGGGGGGGGGDDATFVVPANKCGIIIGRGGETIKQINQQSGAYCEMDRKSQHNTTEKNFNVKGTPEQIEAARRIICDKIGMQIKVLGGSAGGGGGAGAGGYGGGGGGGGNPYAQQWGGPNAGGPTGQYGQWGAEAQMPQGAAGGGPGAAGGADYSAQWIEYYRASGMTREAEIIEAQLKAKQGGGGGGGPSAGGPQQPQQQAANGAGGADYSAQWAEYYRALGKVDEAEAIEKQMKGPKQPAAQVYAMPGQNMAAAYGAAAAAYSQFYGGGPQGGGDPQGGGGGGYGGGGYGNGGGYQGGRNGSGSGSDQSKD